MVESEGSGQLLAAYPNKPLDPRIFAGIRAMLNPMPSALDLLAAAPSKCRGTAAEPTKIAFAALA
ncbi:MAG TPA: hypothetical protein VKI44_23470 [Acetobacteraceae bacterium]|nr:hypothetical protein [Acetobacteraceae bacterium]